MVNKVQVAQTAGREVAELFSKLRGTSVKVSGEMKGSILRKAQNGAGFEDIIGALKNPNFKLESNIVGNGANFDVAILDGKEVVMGAKADVQSENIQGFIDTITEFFGKMKAKKAGQVKEVGQIAKKDAFSLANINKMTEKEKAEIELKLNEYKKILEEKYPRDVLSFHEQLQEARALGLDIEEGLKCVPSDLTKKKVVLRKLLKLVDAEETLRSEGDIAKDLEHMIKQLKEKGIDPSEILSRYGLA